MGGNKLRTLGRLFNSFEQKEVDEEGTQEEANGKNSTDFTK